MKITLSGIYFAYYRIKGEKTADCELVRKGTNLFLTQEKAIKKIQQERSKGELKKAHKRALDALKRWPDDFDIAASAVECCIEMGDNAQAASILKSMLRHHPSKRKKIIEIANSAYFTTSNPIIGSFLIELLIRSNEIEAVEELLRRSPESFVSDLIRRAQTRREGLKEQGISQALIENNLLLALCCIENNQAESAVEPIKEVLKESSPDLTTIGNLLLKIEQEHPDNADAKYCLGLVSLKLNHVDKALPRLFQSLDCSDPPVEDMLSAVDSIEEEQPMLSLLKGELLILKGDTEEGCSKIRKAAEEMEKSPQDPMGFETSETAPRKDLQFAASRVGKLLDKFPESASVAFLYADILEKLGNIKDGIKVLEGLYESDPSTADKLLAWLERDDEALLSAPSKKLLARVYLDSGDIERASEAARMAAEMDGAAIVDLMRWIEQRLEGESETDPLLEVLLAEVASMAGDKERAEEILSRLMEERLVEEERLFALARTIMKNCGISVSGASSAIEACFNVGKPLDALPHLVALYRESPGEHEAIAKCLKSIAEKETPYWEYVNELLDALSGEEKLSFPMKLLQAQAHLKTGEIERAVFEFDQLSMINSDIKYDLVNTYEEASKSYPDNATLQLALYHLNLELELYSDAARHLCKTLELDPQQIKDVIPRFEKLAAREPENRLIWEEMLKSALRIKHTTLARDILKKALEKLPEEDSAALHIYGARIYSSTGNLEDSLKCLAVSLTSPKADLAGILDELEQLKRVSPTNPEVHFLLGETLIRLNREEESIESYRQCISLSPAYREPLKQKLEELLPLSSRPYLISRLLGEVYWADGDRNKALRFFMEAQKGPEECIHSLSDVLADLVEKSPDDSRLSMLFARNLVLEGKYEDSVSILEEIHRNGGREELTAVLAQILQQEPTQPEANRLYARILIDSGDSQSAMHHVINMISDTGAEPQKLDSMVDDFVELFDRNPDFLIAYASLKARRGDVKRSLTLLREALDIDRSKWRNVLNGICDSMYEGELKCETELLRIDCLISGEKYEEATESLTKLEVTGLEEIDPVMHRIEQIASAAPVPKLYTFACSILAEKKGSTEALTFAARGFELFEGDESTSLKVEVAEILDHKGFHREAAELFGEVLAESDDRTKVYVQMEKAYDSWADAEVRSALEAAKEKNLSPQDARRSIETAIDRGRTEEALALLSSVDMEPVERMYLRARIYMSEGKPFDALMVTSAINKEDIRNSDLLTGILYLEGKAAEEVLDFGRAYSAFAKILSVKEDYLDSRRRAGLNYTRFIECSTEDDRVLVKCDEL